MGEVYRARDQKLQRDVAIKILPDVFSGDTEGLSRFRREARLLASLNHPNIAHVYGLEESRATHCIVMELVLGETLQERLNRGPIPFDEALHMALQMAEALEAAHEHGIIHRDLKPGNIMLTRDGKVKVLDFGLAKTSEAGAPSSSLSQAPTRSALTGVDVILGTAAYMSPEQAKGQSVDRRSDIFSFGCVLYEVIAGRQAFAGENTAEILSRVLQRDPDWSFVPAGTPTSIRRLIRLCLEKEIRKRRQSAADVRVDLQQALSEPESSVQPQSTPARRSSHFVSWALVAALASSLGVLATRHFTEKAPAEIRPQILVPSTPAPLEFALSPNGRYFVTVAAGDRGRQLWLRKLNQTQAQPIMGTEGAEIPFWSGDSQSIGYFASGMLYRVSIEGGAPRFVANAPTSRGGAWNSEDTIIFAPVQGGLVRVRASGGEPQALTNLSPGQTAHRFPNFLPDGRHFLFYAVGSAEVSGIYLGSLDGGGHKRLGASPVAASYLHPDRILFARDGALVTQGLDVSRGALTGEPEVIADRIETIQGTNAGGFSVSADGMIAYLAQAAPMQLFWYDKLGKQLGPASDLTVAAAGVELSSDNRVVLQQSSKDNVDIYVWDLLRRAAYRRLTSDPRVDQLPIWSPDGKSVVYISAQKGTGNLYSKPADANPESAPTPVVESLFNKVPQHWSSKNGFLLYFEINPKTGNDLWALDMTSKNVQPRVVANTGVDEYMGQFSPDGRWVAYATNESERFEIVVQPFPGPGNKVPISTNGGVMPRWRADGRELYFIALDGRMFATAVDGTGSSFEAANPRQSFLTPISGSRLTSLVSQYAVASDGRFLFFEPAPDFIAPITLIINRNPTER